MDFQVGQHALSLLTNINPSKNDFKIVVPSVDDLPYLLDLVTNKQYLLFRGNTPLTGYDVYNMLGKEFIPEDTTSFEITVRKDAIVTIESRGAFDCEHIQELNNLSLKEFVRNGKYYDTTD